VDCEWEKYNDRYKCKLCGFIVNDPNIKKNCAKKRHQQRVVSPPRKSVSSNDLPTSSNKDLPPFHKRVFNFAKAAVKHAMAGSPQCTEEEIQTRLEICRQCELFKSYGDGGICSHDNCGCNLKAEQIYLNKLAWADQECPVGKWGKIDKNGV
jgi:hypothetical protein